MTRAKACMTCTKLRKCKVATAEMIDEGGYCLLWEKVSPPFVSARRRIVAEFGPTAVLHVPNPPVQKDKDTMATAKRTLLRKLAIKMGKLKPTPQSFTLQVANLVELLEDDLPGIGDMDSEEIDAILEDTEAAEPAEGEEEEEEKPAPKKGRGRGRAKKKPDPEPEEEEPEEEEEEEKPAPKKRGRGRGRSKPKAEETEEKPTPKRGRGRGRGKAAAKKPTAKKPTAKTESVDDDAPVAQVDLGPLLERLDDIGPMAAKAAEQSEANSTLIADVDTKLDGIIAFLTWQYNETLYDADGELDGDPVDSILEVDWSE